MLGAWGCGVFRNDPEVVADVFREALAVRFAVVVVGVQLAALPPQNPRPSDPTAIAILDDVLQKWD
mgnify:CR=1 FL=1